MTDQEKVGEFVSALMDDNVRLRDENKRLLDASMQARGASMEAIRRREWVIACMMVQQGITSASFDPAEIVPELEFVEPERNFKAIVRLVKPARDTAEFEYRVSVERVPRQEAA